MVNLKLFKQLVDLIGDEDKAREAIQLIDHRITTKKLTPPQKRVYEYLSSGGPVITHRHVAEAAGLDHPNKFAAITAALVVKGYLIPKDVLDKTPDKVVDL